MNNPASNIKEKSVISHQFCKAIRQLQTDGKITDIKAICVMYGYNKGLIRNIESGKQEAPMDMLYKMVVDFSLNPGYFFPAGSKKEELYL